MLSLVHLLLFSSSVSFSGLVRFSVTWEIKVGSLQRLGAPALLAACLDLLFT